MRPIVLTLFISAAAVWLSAASLSISAASLAQDPDSTIIAAQIRSVLHAQQEAWNRGDVNGFMNGYARSKSIIFVSEDTVARGWETVHDRYEKKYSDRPKMGVLTFSSVEITPLSNDAAVVLGRWKLRRAQDQPHGRFTLIFRKTADGLADCARSHVSSSSAALNRNSLNRYIGVDRFTFHMIQRVTNANARATSREYYRIHHC